MQRIRLEEIKAGKIIDESKLKLMAFEEIEKVNGLVVFQNHEYSILTSRLAKKGEYLILLGYERL